MGTGKAFKYAGHDLIRFENGHPVSMKMWGDDREAVKAGATLAKEMFHKLEMAYFTRDIKTFRSLMGNGKISVLGGQSNPAVGVWNTDKFVEVFGMFNWRHSGSRVLHSSKNRVIVEYTDTNWEIAETGQTLMGPKPEDFRFYCELIVNDQGKVVLLETHMTPQPSPFLFTRPGGGSFVKREL